MAFPCPAADSLFPMDHLLSFDVSLTIPKKIRKMIYEAFSSITTYIRGYSLDSRVHRDVCIIQNCWSIPWLGSDSYDSWPSICLEITRIRPFSITLKRYIRNHWDIESIRENWEYRNYSPLLPELYLSLHPFVPLEHCCVLPKIAFCWWACYRSDGGLRWWRPKWGIQFLRFADVPSEVVTCNLWFILIEISFPIQ